MLYITRPGDSVNELLFSYGQLASFTNSYAPQNSIQQRWELLLATNHHLANLGSLYTLITLPAYTPIWLDPSGHNMHTGQSIIHIMTGLNTQQLAMLVQIQDEGFDFNKLRATHKIVLAAKSLQPNNNHNKAVHKAADITGHFGGSLASLHSERLMEFNKTIANTDQKLAAYLKATGEAKHVAHAELRNAFENMNRQFSTEIEHYVSATNAKYFIKHSKLIKGGLRKGIQLSNIEDAKDLVRIAKNFKYLGRGVIALQACLGGYEVYETHEQHGNWEKKASAVSGELIGGVAGGELVITGATLVLGFTPIGWVAIGVAALAIGVGATLSYVGEKIGNLIYSHFHHKHK